MSDFGRLRSRLRALLADHSQAGSALERLCAGVTTVLPVDGAAISVTTIPVGLRPLAASDPVTARLDDVQFTLGEGPCWDAARGGRPVLVGDLTGSAGHRWPMFTAAVLDAGFRSVYALPLQIGAIRLGALGLVATAPSGLDRDAVRDALVVADVAALVLVDLPGDHSPSYLGMPSESTGMRAEVHQATGMVMAQLGVDAQEALVRLRAHAYACGQTANEIARDIVARRLRLEDDVPG